MSPEDRHCFNCDYSELIQIPNVGAKTESDYKGFMICKNTLSDHFQHFLGLRHVCNCHSDAIAKTVGKERDK